MFKTFKYRIYPTKSQEQILLNQLRLCQQLYNAALEERLAAYRHSKLQIDFYQQCRSLIEIKQSLPEYKEVYGQVLQEVLLRLHKAYRHFFRRVKSGEKAGFPRFRGVNRYSSLTYPQLGFSLEECGRFVKFSKVGRIRIRLSRPLEGKIRSATIRHSLGEWYVTYSCEIEDSLPVSVDTRIGIDVGISRLITTSEGGKIENPRFLERSSKRLRRAQRSLSRKKRTSHRRRKSLKRVQKIHRKVTRQRQDYIHKVSTTIVSEYDLIAVEDLKIASMIRGNLSRQISDAGWGLLFQCLSYKAEYAGKRVVRVDPKYTSQMCSQCGFISSENRQTQSQFKCIQCQYTKNADWNAALNILARAELSVGNVPDSTFTEKFQSTGQ